MKNLKCVICGRDISRKKTKRRLCVVCLENKERFKIRRGMLKRINTKIEVAKYSSIT